MDKIASQSWIPLGERTGSQAASGMTAEARAAAMNQHVFDIGAAKRHRANELVDLLDKHEIGASYAAVTALVATDYPALIRDIEALRAQIAASVNGGGDDDRS